MLKFTINAEGHAAAHQIPAKTPWLTLQPLYVVGN